MSPNHNKKKKKKKKKITKAMIYKLDKDLGCCHLCGDILSP